MKTRTIVVPGEEAFVIPIGDLHVGDKAFGKESRRKIQGNIDWVLAHKNAYIFLNGDLLNCATRGSKTSPFSQNMTLEEQIAEVAFIFEPVKDRIIGAISGNHEQRIEDFAGLDPTIAVLTKLGLPLDETYFKYSGVVKVQVGKRCSTSSKPNVAYTLFFHHTTGGGKKIGSKLNRADEMRALMANADVYCGSHNHALTVGVTSRPEYNPYSETVEKRKQVVLTCGGYLEWDGSYAEAKQLEPMELGSPRIRLDGRKKDVRVSLWGGDYV